MNSGASRSMFVDGYADNLRIARPLLERYDVSATFLLTRGYWNRDRDLTAGHVRSPLIHRVPVHDWDGDTFYRLMLHGFDG